jgi:hypothetical protein
VKTIHKKRINCRISFQNSYARTTTYAATLIYFISHGVGLTPRKTTPADL